MDPAEKKARDLLKDLYDRTPCMPIMVRLAWHDSGSYSAKDNTGGANATIRYSPESDIDANKGLDIARNLLEPIKEQVASMSYADLYQLSSVAAIEYAGGPKIPFRLGRKDKPKEDCSPDGRLPDATKRMPHLRDIFYRMGFNDKEIVLLSGAHCLGKAHPERSGFEGPWTTEPLKFDNTYFKEILKPDADPNLLRLASDMALLDEEETKKLVEAYAADQDLFFKEYAVAHQKLSELGCQF
ncbi:putative L-ascorbate peroxidase 4 [Gracilariopsis chorda]|uniref:Putative L-ascorbate peroxidase 4 n=1 Tax=Gracilariopsis chorda TaxID=448386 RepID=A0A2V3IGP3_9FLOR|nr:putative L-ascorbate peroxidase 4 [Gracilariopsis chorda]|eukprot:PXF41247.1 putative L-ascorbate peroxidase 4 [Gracilariopsis chorda]